MPRSICACGKPKSKYAASCKTCYKARTDEIRTWAMGIVASGTCPRCGQPLRRNLALMDWWQCAGYGAEGFRAKDAKPCDFQVLVPQ